MFANAPKARLISEAASCPKDASFARQGKHNWKQQVLRLAVLLCYLTEKAFSDFCGGSWTLASPQKCGSAAYQRWNRACGAVKSKAYAIGEIVRCAHGEIKSVILRSRISSRSGFTHRRWISPVRKDGFNWKQQVLRLAVFMARPAGFEPATYRFVAGHSIRWATGAFTIQSALLF